MKMWIKVILIMPLIILAILFGIITIGNLSSLILGEYSIFNIFQEEMIKVLVQAGITTLIIFGIIKIKEK